MNPQRISDLQGAVWHTSSYSNNGSGCVERGRLLSRRQGVRDTKDRTRGTLVFAAGPWQEFITAVRDGGLA